MANKKIIDLDNGTPKINSYFESTQVDASEPTGRKSTKINFTAMGNWIAGQGISPLEYGNLTTNSQRLVGAINELNSLIAAQYPINEASGAVANFKTQLAAPLVDCVLSINAQQASGTPTPDNPLPITGFTGANIPHTGKNICEGLEQGTLVLYGPQAGSDSPSTTRVRTKYIPVKSGQTYISSSNGWVIKNGCSYDINKNFIAHSIYPDPSTGIITIPDNVYFVRFIYAHSDASETCTPDDFWYQFEYGSTATTYQAYNPNSSTISVDWTTEAGTVYGGELDLLSGVLTDTHSPTPVRLDTLEWTYSSANAIFVAPLVGAKTYASGKPLLTCEIYKTIDVRTGAQMASAENNTITFSTGSAYLMVKDTRYTDVPSFLAGIDDAKMVYELTTPTTYQLTPQEITAFVGVNNIWHDANGDTAVKFKQDIQGYIDEQIASVQALVLNS